MTREDEIYGTLYDDVFLRLCSSILSRGLMLGYAMMSDEEVKEVSQSDFHYNNITSGTTFRVSNDVFQSCRDSVEMM